MVDPGPSPDPAVDFQGELYNAVELCRWLGLPLGTPAAALVSAAWQRAEVHGLLRLDGVFALALRSADGLVLYRDPSALFNLYWHAQGTGDALRVGVATHLDDLLALPGTPRRLSRRSLHEYLRFLDIAAPHTLYEDLHAVEPGQLLRWSRNGGPVASRPQAAADSPPPTSFDDAVDRVDTLLQAGVRARLAGVPRAAAFLSGGIDSSLLCAIASRQRGDMSAVTVGFDGTGFDETPVAQRIAAHLGLRHEVLRFDQAQYLQAFATLARGLEQPMADPATPATVLAYSHCRGRYDAVLDGMGADESVGAMPPRHVRLAVGGASRIPRPLRSALTRGLRALPGLAGYAPIVDFEHPADTMIRWKGFTRPEIVVLCGEPVSFAETQFYRTFARFPASFRNGAHFERYSALLDAMPCDRLNQALQITGATMRFPFWDRATDRCIRELRTDFRHRPGEPKRILRTLLARYVPSQIWDLPKHSFDFPLHDFLMADDHAVLRRHLDPDLWRAHALMSPAGVWRCAQRYIAGERQLVFRVWALALLGAWLEKRPTFATGAPTSPAP
ncbi:MAG: 7-cyano-7-deazaguanine synthase [Betaproteobacteria bacterium]|nr:7-cyano-7-deazaguanine synthase [Betaproteobacteria bacterium]